MKILDTFQSDTRLTTRAIGETVGLSATACQRRINRMRRDGVIEKEIAVVSPKTVGRPLTLIVEVILERGDSLLIDRFKRMVRAAPEVSQCYYVTGRADFMMVVSMSDMEEYEQFTKSFFFNNPDVKSFETSTVMDRTKIGFDLPMMSA